MLEITPADLAALRAELGLPAFIPDSKLEEVIRAVLRHFGAAPA